MEGGRPVEKDISELSVGGYLFYTENDARLARTELQKIEYLEERIDYSAPDTIRYIYEKAIHERLFQTPVGLDYLRKLREYLLSRPEVNQEMVIDIPIYVVYGREVRTRTDPARARILAAQKKDREKSRFILSVILNVLLAAAILVMFYISYGSVQPNIINYERALTDKYASWEQELMEREQTIREKEREMGISQ